MCQSSFPRYKVKNSMGKLVILFCPLGTINIRLVNLFICSTNYITKMYKIFPKKVKINCFIRVALEGERE